MTKLTILGDRLLVERVKRDKTQGGILLPSIINDDYNTGGPKEYRVLQVGPGKSVKGRHIPIECEVGDRILCHSYTEGPVEVDHGQFLITADQILAVLPKEKHHEHAPVEQKSDQKVRQNPV